MREIKFRAWDTIGKEILPNVQNHINDDVWAFGQMLSGDRFSVMQYTWREDSKGKEIYLSDIVRINHRLIGEVRQLEGGQYYINHPEANLKYGHQIHCEVCETESKPFFLDFFDNYELEVIGNIYESPELLEAVNNG